MTRKDLNIYLTQVDPREFYSTLDGYAIREDIPLYLRISSHSERILTFTIISHIQKEYARCYYEGRIGKLSFRRSRVDLEKAAIRLFRDFIPQEVTMEKLKEVMEEDRKNYPFSEVPPSMEEVDAADLPVVMAKIRYMTEKVVSAEKAFRKSAFDPEGSKEELIRVLTKRQGS